MESTTLLKLAKEKEPDLPLLCHLAKKIVPTSSLITDIFLPFFKKLYTYEYEIQVQLSKVYGIHGDKEQHPYWLNNTDLIPVVAHHWLMSQLMTTPKDVITKHTIYQIKNALHHIDCHTRQQLEALLHVLTLQDNIFDREIGMLLESGIQKSKLTYKVSETIIQYLLSSEDYEIVYSTCELMRKYPFIFSEVPEIPLRILMQRGGLYESLALHTLGTWGNNRIFSEVMQGESWQLESKRIILPFLPLTTALMDTLAHYLILHPTYSSDWLESLLQGAYQGIYTSKKRVPELLQHYFEYEFIAAKQLVQCIAATSKEDICSLSLRNTEGNFEKRIKLYQELNTPSARRKIVAYLKETKDSTQLKILLEAIAELKIIEAEPYILPLLQHHFDICLDALHYVGGSKTIAHLKEALEFDASVKQNIPSFEKEALTLLADLVPDQQIIINYLQKHKLPHVDLSNLRLTTPVVNQNYVLQKLDEDEINTVLYGIEKLGELGSIETLAPVIQKIGMMDAFDTFPNPAWKAAQKIANRAYDQHQLRTKKNQRKVVIDTVLAEAILKQLENPLNDADASLYLEYLSEVISAELPIDTLSVLADSPNPHVVKFYISYLGKLNNNSAIKQLKKHLGVTQNIYTLRQALLALTTLENSMLEDLVIPLLGHPNMNIKKTAADYFIANGTVKAVSAMVHLFQRNDNAGLREKLEQGLKSILGEAYYFFLFNECFPCEVPWQRELLGNTITNDAGITTQHYIDFPQLETIASKDKTASNSAIDTQFIKKWKTIRSRTKEDVSQFETSEELANKIEDLRDQAGAVYITDIIAASFRRLKHSPISNSFCPILTTEEVRTLGIENNNSSLLWNYLLLDPESEAIEYKNLLVYKNGKTKEKLFFHFLAHYGLEKILTQLIEANEIGFLKKVFVNTKITQPKYLALCIALYTEFRKQKKNEELLSSLEDSILNHPFINRHDQIKFFFSTATIEGKINRLGSYASQQQSLLKEEIMQLYNNSSWKQRNALLRTIKTPENHKALFELSFTEYVKGKELPFLNGIPFNPLQIQQFEKHIDAIELTKNRAHYLQFHNNEFVLLYLKEVASDQEADPRLLYSFHQFNTERKWDILKTELAQEHWYWLSFFDEFSSINTAIKETFKEASTNGKLALVKNLTNSGKQLYFPGFMELLIPFVKECNSPIEVWPLLFNLQLNTEEKKELINEFSEEYARYTTSTKIEVLTHFLKHTIPSILVHSKVFNTLVPTDANEETLLLQLRLKTVDHTTIEAPVEAIQWIKQLTKRDVALAKQSLVEVVEHVAKEGLPKQMHILNACYPLTELSTTVSTQIAHIFSTELLALSFLTDAHKKLFYKQIGELIKTSTTEIDKKGLLKNLADESPEESKSLLVEILLSQKKTDIDTLCLRLLKKSTSRPAYLEICYTLLFSNKENLFPSIIRTLSFARYAPAIPVFIKLLTHKKDSISKVAREGLLIMGKESIPMLIKETNNVRPDKRTTLQELLKEIEEK